MQEKRYIGNIVTSYSADKFPKFFNVVKECSDQIDGIPTIVIGLEEARKCIEGFSILKKKYDNGDLWWTYKKTERKYEFDVNIKDFYDFCFARFFKNIQYFYLDIPKYRYNTLKKLLKWIREDSYKLCFLTRESNFVFIYDMEAKVVFGLSLTLMEYMGVERRKVVQLIRSNKYNHFVYDTSFLTPETRMAIKDNTHLILPLASILKK